MENSTSESFHHFIRAAIIMGFAVYIVYLVPLLMGFLMPNTALSSAVANKKGMNLTANTALNKSKPTGIYKSNDVLQLHATNIEKIKAPESPYVYPNMDAVTEVMKP